MNRRDTIMSMAGTAVIFTLGGCQVGFTRSFRFRMTVEVMTLQGLKTGSAVYEIYAAPYFDPTLPTETTGGFRGQATIVDMPDGPLFVLASGSSSIQPWGPFYDSAFKTLAGVWDNKAVNEKYLDAISRLRHEEVKVELPKSILLPSAEYQIWPAMVRFADINDPSSVRKVDPNAIGVKRIWLETTRDKLTKSVDQKFPHFLETLKVMQMKRTEKTSRNIFTTSFSDMIGPRDFSTGFDG